MYRLVNVADVRCFLNVGGLPDMETWPETQSAHQYKLASGNFTLCCSAALELRLK